jgi:PAS domain S-box-containing protein
MVTTKGNNDDRNRTVVDASVRPEDGGGRTALMERRGGPAKRSEEILRIALRSSSESITVSSLADGRFIDVNERFEKVCGYNYSDVVGKTSLELGLWKNPGERSRLESAIRRDGKARDFEAEFVMADGDVRQCLVSAEVLEIDGEPCMVATVRDVTDVRRAEEALRWYDERLQNERQSVLEKEAALKQILSHMEEKKSAYRSEVTSHVINLMEPVISILRGGQGRPDHKDVDRLEQYLKKIVNEDVDEFRDCFSKLTVRELDICAAIKQGLSSKEIADQFGLSVNTVHKHRQVIRRKLCLNNKGVNLAAFLRSR